MENINFLPFQKESKKKELKKERIKMSRPLKENQRKSFSGFFGFLERIRKPKTKSEFKSSKKILRKSSFPKKTERLSEAEVNLLPEEIARTAEAKKERVILFNFLFWSIFLVGLIYFGLLSLQVKTVSQREDLKSEILKIEKEMERYLEERKKFQVLKEKIEAVNFLLNEHTYWTNFFTFLEAHTIPEVAYLNFSGEKNKVVLQAVAKDYLALARQIVAFQEEREVIKDIKISPVNLQEKEGGASLISFSITLTLQPDLLKISESH